MTKENKNDIIWFIMNTIIYITACLIFWNLLVFILYGCDKRKAKKNKWRTSEFMLLACAFLMGGVGAILGMHVFRHKTQHLRFKILVPLAVIVNIGVVVLLKLSGIFNDGNCLL